MPRPMRAGAVMAFPVEVAKGPTRLKGMPRTADDFERLATAFRPAWELDDGPFTGPGTLSASDVQALHGGGPNAELRAAKAQALNGDHAAPKPVASTAPVASIIVEPALAPATPEAPPPPSLAETLAAMAMSRPAPAPAAWAPPPSHPWQPLPASRAPTPTPTLPPARGRTLSIDGESSASFARPSKKPLWIGAGLMVVVLAAGVRVISGGHDKPAPALEATAKPVENARVYAIPPPPPETATAAVAPVPAPVVSATVAALPAAPPVAAPPPVAHVVPATQPAARPVYAPARPAPRKAPSIVRDVPF
jgi:hypothetical protein